jgi:hypothetical protein
MRSGELSALTATPTGVAPIIPSYGLIGLWYMSREGSEEFEGIEFMCPLVFGGVCHNIILDRDFIESEGPSFDVSGYELF